MFNKPQVSIQKWLIYSIGKFLSHFSNFIVFCVYLSGCLLLVGWLFFQFSWLTFSHFSIPKDLSGVIRYCWRSIYRTDQEVHTAPSQASTFIYDHLLTFYFVFCLPLRYNPHYILLTMMVLHDMLEHIMMFFESCLSFSWVTPALTSNTSWFFREFVTKLAVFH